MKKIISILLILSVFLCSCSSVQTAKPSAEDDDSVFARGKILVVIDYRKVDCDYSVYNVDYFGDAYSECKVYDAVANYGLFVILKLKDSEVRKIKKHIAALYENENVSFADSCEEIAKEDEFSFHKMILPELSEYKEPQSPVKLLHRRYVFAAENSEFQYNRKYRYIYYTGVDTEFQSLAPSDDEYDVWYKKYWEENVGAPLKVEPKEMPYLSFVKYFNIPKADFERVVQQKENDLRIFFGDSFPLKTEQYELPNPDIIYTFDSEVINEYYLYK